MAKIDHNPSIPDRIRQFIALPVFPDDADKTRTAANIYTLLYVSIVGSLGLLSVRFETLDSHLRLTLGFMNVGFIGLMILTKRRRNLKIVLAEKKSK